MRLQQNRYLWAQVVGLAAVPLLLDICLVGLASSGLAVPFGFQFWVIALLGITPTLWMQLTKPFYVFSLPPVALNPTVLNDEQRRCLTVLKSWQVKALAGLMACFSLWVLLRVYAESSQVTPLLTPRAGLISAALAFFLSCAFLQISVSAVRVLLVGPEALKRVAPYETSAVTADFLILGLQVKRIFSAPVETKIELSNDDPSPLADVVSADETLAQETVDESLNSKRLESESLAERASDDDLASEEPEEPEDTLDDRDDGLALEGPEDVLADKASGIDPEESEDVLDDREGGSGNEKLEDETLGAENSDDAINQLDLKAESQDF